MWILSSGMAPSRASYALYSQSIFPRTANSATRSRSARSKWGKTRLSSPIYLLRSIASLGRKNMAETSRCASARLSTGLTPLRVIIWAEGAWRLPIARYICLQTKPTTASTIRCSNMCCFPPGNAWDGIHVIGLRKREVTISAWLSIPIAAVGAIAIATALLSITHLLPSLLRPHLAECCRPTESFYKLNPRTWS